MVNSMESHNSKRGCRFREELELNGVNKRRKQSLLGGGDQAINKMEHQREEDSLSDTGSSVSFEKTDVVFDSDRLVRLEEGDPDCSNVKTIFLSGLGSMVGANTKIVNVYKNSFSDLMGRARIESFRIFSEAMRRRHGGCGNVRYAWFGGSKEEISRIISYGFVQWPVPVNRTAFGYGLCLSPQNSSLDAIESSIVDEDGVRHVLLCRVILGKQEVIFPGSPQLHPSSSEFDSGVDNLQHPEKYIVWSANMNSHVLPEFLISFKAPFLNGVEGIKEPVAKPNSPWMPFPALIAILGRSLPPNIVGEIEKYHAAYRGKKITRHHLVQLVRHLAGDKLLMSIIKSYRAKEVLKATASPTSNNKHI